ncbi:unnamed protein product [Linum tenue]|nr:unnamed protein product [Linum tenue]
MRRLDTRRRVPTPQDGARPEPQPRPPRGRIRHGGPRQDRTRARMPRHCLLRRHPSCRDTQPRRPGWGPGLPRPSRQERRAGLRRFPRGAQPPEAHHARLPDHCLLRLQRVHRAGNGDPDGRPHHWFLALQGVQLQALQLQQDFTDGSCAQPQVRRRAEEAVRKLHQGPHDERLQRRDDPWEVRQRVLPEPGEGAGAACLGSSHGRGSEDEAFCRAVREERDGILHCVCSGDGEAQHLQDQDRERW